MPDILEERPQPVPPARSVRRWDASEKVLVGILMLGGLLGIAWLCAVTAVRPAKTTLHACAAARSAAATLPKTLLELQVERGRLLRRLVAVRVIHKVRGTNVYVLPGFYTSKPSQQELVCNMICAWVYKLPADMTPDPKYRLAIYDAVRDTEVGSYSFTEGLKTKEAKESDPIGTRGGGAGLPGGR